MATQKTPTTTIMTDQTTHPNKTDSTSSSNKDRSNAKSPTDLEQQTDIQITSQQINTTKDKTTSNPIQSSQPRFSTSDIVKKFPHIKHRYCHKIKISIPWDDNTNPPTPDTYYKSIHYFFQLVKKYDDQFKILTWDIVNKKCDTISDPSRLPKCPKELSYYLYNVHMTPSRVRASMVVHSSYNLGDLIHRRLRLDKTQLELLQTFRQEKLWVQPTTVQTMGEIKLIGFLQFIHPKYTNLKKLTIELQAIVETRDISVEIYRPRATDENGHIITAPEAIAIGAPSDISIDVYKSLINRWPDVIDGDYDMVIGKESTLKMGYFIPFINGILNRADKNEAIFNHEKFLKDYTSVKIKYCSSVDVRFQLSQSEMSILELYGKEKKPGQLTKTTLRRIINSWSIDSDPHFLVQAIEQSNATTQLLLVKKKNKSEVLTRLHQLINILKTRQDYSEICGNSDGSKATIDKFVFTTTGHNYLNYLKGQVRPFDSNSDNTDGDTIDADDNCSRDGKRKLQSIRTTQYYTSNTNSISPTYKKSSDASSPTREQSDNDTESSTPTTKNTIKHSTTLKGYANVVKTNPSYFSHLPPTESTIVRLPKDTSNPTFHPNQHTSQSKSSSILEHPNDTIPHASRHVVPYVNVGNTELTISTMTPDINKGYEGDRMVPAHMMHPLTSTHVQDITLAVSKKYESMLTNLISTQQSQATEIATLKDSQSTLKNDIELQIHDKMEKQNLVLTSLVEIVQNMQNKDRAMQANISSSATADKTPLPSVNNKESPPLSDHDLSYSDRDEFSNTSDHSDTIQTKTTVPNTVTTDISQEYKLASTDTACSTTMHNMEDHSVDDSEEIPPTEIQYKSKTNSSSSCPHLNNVSSSMSEDVRKMTMTSSVDSLTIHQRNGWKDITDKTRKATKIKHAVISPAKPQDEKYDKTSPSFNKYDPDGSIIRRSNRIKDKLSQEVNSKDHSSRRTRSSMKGGRLK
jgi:hypothetical protein